MAPASEFVPIDPLRSPPMVHFPAVSWHGRRYRARCRWLTHWHGLQWVGDAFAEGTVWRVWIGWLLVTVMIDATTART